MSIWKNKTESINHIDAEVNLITEVYAHIKCTLFWKEKKDKKQNKEATLHDLFKNMKK